jgi:hypothetical protein
MQTKTVIKDSEVSQVIATIEQTKYNKFLLSLLQVIILVSTQLIIHILFCLNLLAYRILKIKLIN